MEILGGLTMKVLRSTHRTNEVKFYLTDTELSILEVMRGQLEATTGSRVTRSAFIRRALLALSAPEGELMPATC